MRSWYNTEERLQTLFRVVAGWMQTPFMLNGKTKEGCGCAGGQLGIHCETGALEDFELPRGTGRLGDQIALAHMSTFLETRPEFFRVHEEVQAGDIITGRTIVGEYHLGTFLGLWKGQQQSFIHCIPKYGMSHSNLLDPTYRDRLVAVWRIKHEGER